MRPKTGVMRMGAMGTLCALGVLVWSGGLADGSLGGHRSSTVLALQEPASPQLVRPHDQGGAVARGDALAGRSLQRNPGAARSIAAVDAAAPTAEGRRKMTPLQALTFRLGVLMMWSSGSR